MQAEIFDTLSVSKRLMSGGLSREASERIAEVMKETIESQLATKKDIADLRKEMLLLKKDILLTLGGMIVAAVTIILTALPLLINR